MESPNPHLPTHDHEVNTHRQAAGELEQANLEKLRSLLLNGAGVGITGVDETQSRNVRDELTEAAQAFEGRATQPHRTVQAENRAQGPHVRVVGYNRPPQ